MAGITVQLSFSGSESFADERDIFDDRLEQQIILVIASMSEGCLNQMPGVVSDGVELATISQVTEIRIPTARACRASWTTASLVQLQYNGHSSIRLRLERHVSSARALGWPCRFSHHNFLVR